MLRLVEPGEVIQHHGVSRRDFEHALVFLGRSARIMVCLQRLCIGEVNHSVRRVFHEPALEGLEATREVSANLGPIQTEQDRCYTPQRQRAAVAIGCGSEIPTLGLHIGLEH